MAQSGAANWPLHGFVTHSLTHRQCVVGSTDSKIDLLGLIFIRTEHKQNGEKKILHAGDTEYLMCVNSRTNTKRGRKGIKYHVSCVKHHI